MTIRELTTARAAEIRKTASMKIRRNCKHVIFESDSTECVLVIDYIKVREEIKAGNSADFFRVKDSDIHVKTIKYENTRNATVKRMVDNGVLVPVPCRRSIPGKNSPVLYEHDKAERIIAEYVVAYLYGPEAVKDIHYTGENSHHWADFRIYGEGYEIKCKGAWWNDRIRD